MYMPQISRPSGETLHRCTGCAARAHGLCQALDKAALAGFCSLATGIRLAADAPIFHAEAPVQAVASVVKGVMRFVQLLPDGRRQVAAFAFPGDFLGFTLEQRHHFTVEAVTEAELCVVTRPDFEAFVAANACMATPLYAIAAHELEAARAHLVLLGRKTAQERLATFLLHMAAHTPQQGPVMTASLPMSRADIADHLGLRLESACRELCILKAAGLVAMDGPQDVLILDPEGLEERATGAFDRY